MKASMDSKGVITLKAETGAEAFALQQWMGKASIPVNDLQRCLNNHWNPSWLAVDATGPGER